MKQFKEWNKIHHINDVRLLTEPDINIKEKQRRKGWRAALEFAIEEIIGCLSPQDAIEILREELEGGDK